MKDSKPTSEDVEIFHDKGDYVIICLPEYLSDIEEKLSASSIPHSEPEAVVSSRIVDANTRTTVNMIMNEVRVPHNDRVLEWFHASKGRFETTLEETNEKWPLTKLQFSHLCTSMRLSKSASRSHFTTESGSGYGICWQRMITLTTTGQTPTILGLKTPALALKSPEKTSVYTGGLKSSIPTRLEIQTSIASF